MNTRRLALTLVILAFALPSVAAAKEWYDYYREGIAAARSQSWSTVIEKMNQAIALKPQEESRARTYGAIFIAYRPYYYRGIAHLSMGNTAPGVADLERTGGPGEVNLGAVETLLIQARQALQAQVREQERERELERERERQQAQQPPAQQPVQPPAQQPAPPTRPPTTTPSRPTVDPALAGARSRAESLLGQANAAAQDARRQQAPSLAAQQFQQGERLLLQASSAQTSANSAADWNQVADLADRAQRALRASITTATAAANASRSLPSRTTDEVLMATRTQLRDALESYFGGRFSDAARSLDALSRGEGRSNAMVWAFLGASRYFDYYLEGERDANKRNAAVDAFRQARAIDPSLELPARYFAPRVQRFYQSAVTGN